MARTPRRVSCSGYYHVILKGNGRQALFEDDDDRRTFLRVAQRCFADSGVSVLAWCLMENHVHLLLRDEGERLSPSIHRLATTYARRYNDRSGHVGHVFEARFKNAPIETESYLLEAVRYIHNNPEKAGLCRAEEYPWSSYADYVGTAERCDLVVDTALVNELLGGPEGFAEFCAARPGAYRPPAGRRLKEAEAREVAERVLGGLSPHEVASLPVTRRNALLRSMRAEGLSVRQIERLTGVGRNIVARA